MTQPVIAFIATHPSGGVGELWSNLAQAFEDRGCRISKIGFFPPPAVEAQSRPAGWRFGLDGRIGNPLRLMRLLAWLYRTLRDERPDAAVTAMPAANVLVPLVARLASPRTRVVTTHHSPTSTHSRLLDTLDGLTGRLPQVAAVVSVSKAVEDSLAHKAPAYRAKCRTITNALPPDVERETDALARLRDRSASHRRTIVSTGRLAYQKNYPMLIRAMTHLPDARLDIIGGGPDEASLRALAEELGLNDRVVFRGRHPRAEALRLLADGDVFAQVSRFEGHSLALIEAARLGIPLVVSDIPEQVEAVTLPDGERCAAIVPLEDDAGLAAAIRSLLDDRAHYAAAADAARRLAAQSRFSDTVDAYASILLPEGAR
jgi:glycosyltransferase involved in cell wall biosynthesis